MTLSPGSLTYNDMIRYEVALVNEGLGGQAQARPLSYLGPDNKRGSRLAVNKKLGWVLVGSSPLVSGPWLSGPW